MVRLLFSLGCRSQWPQIDKSEGTRTSSHELSIERVFRMSSKATKRDKSDQKFVSSKVANAANVVKVAEHANKDSLLEGKSIGKVID